MKVKELIAELQKLDQEKNIWIIYDYPWDCFEPCFAEQIDAQKARVFKNEGCKRGDYVCFVG